MLAMQGHFQMVTLPHEWREYCTKVGGLGYRQQERKGKGSTRDRDERDEWGGPSKLMDNMSPYGGNGGQREEYGNSPNRNAWKKKHEDRYKMPARNNNVNPSIAKLVEGLPKGTEWSTIEVACQSSHYKLKECEGIPEGICPPYALGYCTYKGCTARHLYDSETPRAWTNQLCKKLRPGIEKNARGDEIKPRKKTNRGKK